MKYLYYRLGAVMALHRITYNWWKSSKQDTKRQFTSGQRAAVGVQWWFVYAPGPVVGGAEAELPAPQLPCRCPPPPLLAPLHFVFNCRVKFYRWFKPERDVYFIGYLGNENVWNRFLHIRQFFLIHWIMNHLKLHQSALIKKKNVTFWYFLVLFLSHWVIFFHSLPY